MVVSHHHSLSFSLSVSLFFVFLFFSVRVSVLFSLPNWFPNDITLLSLANIESANKSTFQFYGQILPNAWRFICEVFLSLHIFLLSIAMTIYMANIIMYVESRWISIHCSTKKANVAQCEHYSAFFQEQFQFKNISILFVPLHINLSIFFATKKMLLMEIFIHRAETLNT